MFDLMSFSFLNVIKKKKILWNQRLQFRPTLPLTDQLCNYKSLNLFELRLQ